MHNAHERVVQWMYILKKLKRPVMGLELLDDLKTHQLRTLHRGYTLVQLSFELRENIKNRGNCITGPSPLGYLFKWYITFKS